MIVPACSRSVTGPCAICGAGLAADSFRDQISYRDAFVSGLCQSCQDLAYLSSGPDDLRAYPIHDGALVAVRAPGHVAELALVPFRFVVPDAAPARLVWEARFITRAGPYQDPLGVRHEFEPMSELLAGHQVRVTRHAAFTDASVLRLLEGLHLLVGLDDAALDALVTVCRVPENLALAGLVNEVPWADAFGRALRPLETWWSVDADPVSTLRALAVMGRLLVDVGRDGMRPLDQLLSARPQFAPVSCDA